MSTIDPKKTINSAKDKLTSVTKDTNFRWGFMITLGVVIALMVGGVLFALWKLVLKKAKIPYSKPTIIVVFVGSSIIATIFLTQTIHYAVILTGAI